MQTLYPQLLIPFGVIVAAIITSVTSLVSLVVAKELNVSGFRQQWLDSLRQDVAAFASSARRISSERSIPGIGMMLGGVSAINETREEMLRGDPFHENRNELAQSYYSIRLRLNASELDHKLVLEGLDHVLSELRESNESDSFERTVMALDSLAVVTQKMLKREWVRVKKGEPIYRQSLLSVIIIFLFSFAFAIFILAHYLNYPPSL